MKRILLTAAVLLTILLPRAVQAAMADTAESACVMNALTGEVIFEKNAYERRPMASTTKIMTAVTALENSSMDEVVQISKNAESQEGSSAYIRSGNTMYMEDLLYGLMLNSGNDAAVAIAEHISGTSEEFAKRMTKKALEIGAKDTSFMNPSGLDDENHYTTARDLALIARYALKNPDFVKITSTKEILKHPIGYDEDLWFINHNKLLKSCIGCIGVKTGYTKTAGRCLVSAAERNGMTFIAVTLNDRNDWKDHTEMLDYAFGEYSPKEIISEGERVKTASSGGENHAFVTASAFVLPYKEGNMLPVDIETHIAENTSCPINAGEKVGYMDISYGGEKIGRVDIISKHDIFGEEKLTLKDSFADAFLRVLKLWSV